MAFERHELERFDRLNDLLERLAIAQETFVQILERAFKIPGPAVKILLEAGASEMAEKAKATAAQMLVDSATNRVFVIGVDSLGAEGASLNPGDSVALSIDNTAIATITLDATPVNDPSGRASVASGVVSPVTPINTGTSFNAMAVATIGGTAQAAVELELQWQAGAATAVLEEAN